MSISRDTKLSDLLNSYPWLKDEITRVNEKFSMLKSPVGKLLMKKATVADMSRRSGMDENVLISKLEELIRAHE